MLLAAFILIAVYFIFFNNPGQPVDQAFIERYRNDVDDWWGQICYASDDIVIFYDAFALIVYDLNEMQITGAVDLKEIGMNYRQGSLASNIHASSDGNIVIFEKIFVEIPKVVECYRYVYHTKINKVERVNSFDDFNIDLFEYTYEFDLEIMNKLGEWINTYPSSEFVKIDEKYIYTRRDTIFDGDNNNLEIVIRTPDEVQVISVF